MTPQQVQAVRQLAKGFVETVKEAQDAGGGIGVPGGIMYAALMDKLSLSQFEQIMGGLVKAGYLRKAGDCYFHVRDLG